MVVQCSVGTDSRKNLFWATQPDACGDTEICGYECGEPGLSLTTVTGDTTGDCPMDECDPVFDPDCPIEDTVTTETSATIATNDWVRGLIINMLMTDGRRPDSVCGLRPGSQGGHWSESYITGGDATIGTLMRYIDSVGRIQDNVNSVIAYARATVERLVERGVAMSVDVTGEYAGGSKMNLDIIVYGLADGDARVNLSGGRLEQGWVWN